MPPSMSAAAKEKALALYLRDRIRDSQVLNIAMALLTTVGHIAHGAYSDACTEKQARGYKGAVSLAMEGLDVAMKAAGSAEGS